jgi:hypothetical protein
MIDPTELAALEETRLATSLPEVADSTLAFGPDEGGGVACIGSKGSWANTAVGLGMWGTVPLAAIDRPPRSGPIFRHRNDLSSVESSVTGANWAARTVAAAGLAGGLAGG